MSRGGRQWKHAADVPADSATGRQLALMRQFAEGRIPPDVFAVGWLGARRAAMESGERVAERIGRPLDQVFYALDDYPIDPRFREEGDTTDEQLMACVQEQVGRIGG